MSGKLTLRLLGAFRAELDNQPLRAFESDKSRALLAFLALKPGEAARREVLCALFWPELTPERARANLSQALSSLRGPLGDRTAETPILVADRKTVRVSARAGVKVDALAFDALLASCADGGISPEQQAERRREALGLYEGDFLRGLSLLGSAEFDDWVAIQRERRHRAALDALQWLADYHETRGEPEEAERHARRQIELEPWREEAHRQLMRLLAHQGRRSAALAQYERCRRALADEFGVEPTAATSALYERIARSERSRLLNLPGDGAPFIGREEELAQLATMLARPQQRLLSLLGPGGSGKTALALALAQRVQERFLDGAVALFLSGLTERDELLSALVGALALTEGEADLLTRVKDFLRDKEMLLLLDNCEQLLALGEVAETLLDAAPDLKILTTSRHALRVRAETRFPLAGLSVAPAGANQEKLPEAARLFVQAAQRVRPAFSASPRVREAVVEICSLVDGLPLAIELAASWVHAATPNEIAAEMGRSLDFLVDSASGMPVRHASLRSVWDHSWGLLSAEEQNALARLTVFPGPFRREAIAEVAGTPLPILVSLADKSLLYQNDEGRYRLHPVVREYAAAALEEAESRALRDAHAAYYLSLLASAEEELSGDEAARAHVALRPEMQNLRLAWETAVGEDHWESLEPATDALAAFYTLEGVPGVASDSFGRAAEELAAAAEPRPNLRAKWLALQSRFLLKLGASEQALAHARRALDLATVPETEAVAQLALGRVLERRGEPEPAATAFERALQLGRSLDDSRLVARALNGRGSVHWRHASYEAAIDDFYDALHMDRAAGNLTGVVNHLSNLGIVYKEMGRFPEALSLLSEGLALAERLGHREAVARAANNLGLVYWQMGRREQALDAYERALAIAELLGIRRGILVAVSNIGVIHRELGRYEEALGCYQRAISIARERSFLHPLAVTLGNTANIYRDMGRYWEAWPYYEEALALDEELGNREGVGRQWGEIGRWFALQGDDEQARVYLEKAADRLRELGVPYYLSTVLPALTEVCLRLGDIEAAAFYHREAEALVAEVERPQAKVQVALAGATLAAARNNVEAAHSRLEALFESVEEPDEQAAVAFTLWELTGDGAWGRKALVRYRELAAAIPNATYRDRRDRLQAALDA